MKVNIRYELAGLNGGEIVTSINQLGLPVDKDNELIKQLIKTIKKAKEDSYKEGFSEGYSEGYDDGLEEAWED